MGRGIVIVLVGLLVFGAFAVVALTENAAADGSVSGDFPNRMFTITRSPPGGPKSDTFVAPIHPTASGRWTLRLESLTGSAIIIEVYRIDGSIPTLEGSSKLRAAGTSSAPIALFGGMTYEIHFTPYGKAGPDVLTEHFVPNIPPTACFTYSPLSPIAGQLISFDASCSSDSDGTIVSYTWDFGDGATGSGKIATHAYVADGQYTVVLQVTDDLQGFDTHSQVVSVAVNIPPTASFTHSPANPLVGAIVSFDGSGSSDPDDTIASYAWTFGDGVSGSGAIVTHAYSAGRTYTVTLTVTDSRGATGSLSQDIRVLAPPTAAFTFSPSLPKVGDTISFDASGSSDSDGTIVSYDWDFGDGSTGSGVTATHAYSAKKTYTVVLTVTDDDGLTGTASHDVSVGGLPPIAMFTFSPALPLQGTSVSFDGSTSSDPDGTVVSYAWTFGDGGTGSGATPMHTYLTYGSYPVALTVTDDDGLTGTQSQSIRIAAAPIAAFTFSPVSPQVGTTVFFDASGSTDADGIIASYAWTFGDASCTPQPSCNTASGKTVTHAYGALGSYDVVLTVMDSDGFAGTIMHTVRVLSAPTASFTFSPALPLEGSLVSFDGRGSSDSDGTIVSYAWTFGDGATASGATTTHTYVRFGSYPVALTVTDDDGLTGTQSQSIRIAAAPIAAFTFSPSSPLVGATVSFDASGSTDADGTITSYAWDFADSATGSGSIVTHSYSAYGSYNVRLVVTDTDGFTGTTAHSVHVLSPPTASFTFTPALPLQGASVSFDASGSSDLDGTIAAYAWSFGDGGTGTGATPVHTYATYGSYPVILVVTDSDGLTGMKTQSIRIAAPPVASFTFTPSSPLVGATVSFDASGSTDADGTIASYAWTFGDGATGSGKTVTHAYTTAGPNTVQLTVTDDDGFTGTTSQVVTIRAANIPPTASFVFSPASPKVGDTVTFDGSSSTDTDGTIVAYAWDFGDASCSPQPSCNRASGVTATHAYAAAGSYHVTLTVTDSGVPPLTGSITKDVPVTQGGLPGEDWTFYDFFDVPYGEWWAIRQGLGLTGDAPIGAECFSTQPVLGGFLQCMPSDPNVPDVPSFPFTNWVKTPVGDYAINAPYRFTADIRQNPAFTVERPVILPRCDDLRAAAATAGVTISCPSTLPTGGSLSVDERISYLTDSRVTELLSQSCPDLTFVNDGFVTELNATITMDSIEAAKLFGVTDPSQWAFGTAADARLKLGCGTGIGLPPDPSSGVLEQGLKAWFEAQGNGPYYIHSAFGVDFAVFAIQAWGSYDATTGRHKLTLDLVAWGLETLFARWAYWGATAYTAGVAGAAPVGWWGMEQPWTEDLRFLGKFGTDAVDPSKFDAQVSGVIQYHFRASADATNGIWYDSDDVAKWVWQPVLGDRYPGPPINAYSELTAYADPISKIPFTYIHTTPGTNKYGTPFAYDYVPAVWALKSGETQTFRFPTTPVVLYDPLSQKTGDPRTLVSISASITLGYSVPATGVGTFDAATNTLTVVGPTSLTAPLTSTGKPAESRPIYNLVRK